MDCLFSPLAWLTRRWGWKQPIHSCLFSPLALLTRRWGWKQPIHSCLFSPLAWLTRRWGWTCGSCLSTPASFFSLFLFPPAHSKVGMDLRKLPIHSCLFLFPLSLPPGSLEGGDGLAEAANPFAQAREALGVRVSGRIVLERVCFFLLRLGVSVCACVRGALGVRVSGRVVCRPGDAPGL